MRIHAVAFVALILSASGNAAQTTQPPPVEEGVIVVTGTRGSDRALSVDFEKVARECVECRRVLARMAGLKSQYTNKKEQIGRDRASRTGSIAAHTRSSGDRRGPKVPDGADFLNPYSRNPEQTQSGRFAAQASIHEREDLKELASTRRDVASQVASYLAQLEPFVIKAAEDERIERKASVVLKANRWAKKEKAIDVTQAVIGRLNAMQIAIILPSIEKPEVTENR